jgi:hypothetical protein
MRDSWQPSLRYIVAEWKWMRKRLGSASVVFWGHAFGMMRHKRHLIGIEVWWGTDVIRNAAA